jgi:hypothetical protein
VALGFAPFRERVSSRQPPVTQAVGRFTCKNILSKKGIIFMADKSKGKSSKSKDTSVTVAWIGAGATIIAALIGVFALWVQPQKDEEKTPTSTVAPTETRIASTSTPEILYMDDFSSGSSKWWSTNKEENDYWTSSPSITSGSFQWQATAKQTVFATLFSDVPPLLNFDMEITLERIDNSINNSYGVTFFATRGVGGYDLMFEASKPGIFKLQRRDGNNATPIIDFTNSSAINKNGSNRIRILVNDSLIKIFFNGKFEGEVPDNTYRTGKIGLFAGMLEGETVILELDDFSIATPSFP